MKRLLALSLATLVTISLAGCSSKTGNLTSKESTNLSLNTDNNNKIISGDIEIKTLKYLTVEDNIETVMDKYKKQYETEGKKVLVPKCDFQDNMECETLIAVEVNNKVTDLNFTCFPSKEEDLVTYITNNKSELINNSLIANEVNKDDVILLRTHISEGIPSTTLYWKVKDKISAFALAYNGKGENDK